MIYVYECDGCGKKYDVVKPVAEYQTQELCPLSGVTMTKAVAPSRLYFSGTKVQDKVFNPAFGRPMTDSEARAEAKARGLIEVGNESIEKHCQPEETHYPDFSEEDIKSLTPEKLAAL